MLNVLQGLFKISHSVDVKSQHSVERYFSVDVSLSVHETAIKWGLLKHCGFFICNDLPRCLVADCDADLADDAIFPLTVACAVNKNNALHLRRVRNLQVASFLFLVVFHKVEDVFYWHLCVANHELFLVLENDEADVEKASFSEMVLDSISFA